MSTDLQQARVALGVRLRELRADDGLSGRDLAGGCGWLPSKVSKLENGRQTPGQVTSPRGPKRSAGLRWPRS